MLCAGAFLAMAACGSDSSTGSSGPVTFVPVAVIADDTISGRVIVDNATVLHINEDSIVGLGRGDHTVNTRLNVEYLADEYTLTVDPAGDRFRFDVDFAASCRTSTGDAVFCNGNSLIVAPQSRRLLCRVNDFGEFCTASSDPQGVGLRWPVDLPGESQNGYASQAKLLIGARMSANVPTAANDTMAMALYRPGDYGPRTRLKRLTADSLKWQTQVWTDLRRMPFFGLPPVLDPDERPNDNFGLEVKTTYQLSATSKDVLLVRFDVTNISTDSS